MNQKTNYQTNFGALEVVKYHNSQNVDVRFLATGHERKATAKRIREGKVKDPLFPNVFGVGYVGIGVYPTSLSGNQTKANKVWSDMLKRCYSERHGLSCKSYIGCTVDPIWHNYQNFAKWFDDNYIAGKQLDKDILHQGNKVYSPENCIFVSQAINKLLSGSGVSKGNHKTGCHWNTLRKKFQSECRHNGKTVRLGFYTDEQKAHEVYKDYKYKVIAEVAKSQSEPLKSALLNYRIM